MEILCHRRKDGLSFPNRGDELLEAAALFMRIAMIPYADDVRRFLDALRETPDVWRSIDIRVIALHIDGEWHNLVTRCRIDSRLVDEIPRLAQLPSNDLLSCRQDVRDAGSLESLLVELRSGSFLVGGLRVNVKEFNDETSLSGPPYQNGYARLGSRESAASMLQKPQQFRAHILTITTSRGGRLLTSLVRGGEGAIAQFLRSLDHPWDGVEGLARVALATPTDASRLYQPTLEFVAPLGVAFDTENTRLESGRLTLSVLAESLAAGRNCSVGYVAEFSDGAYLNGSVPLGSRRWKGRTVRSVSAQVKIGAATRVTLLLRLGSHIVDTIPISPVGGPWANTQAMCYLVLDPHIRVLRHVLARQETEALKAKDGAREFEWAVARLLSLAGLHTDALDTLPGLQDAVDVLASMPDGAVVLAVECTLGALNTGKGKPSKLVNRVDELRRRLEASGVEVFPIMATCRQRSSLSKGDVAYVAEDGVAVLAHDDLQQIAEGIENGWGAETTLSFCRERIGNQQEDYGRGYFPTVGGKAT